MRGSVAGWQLWSLPRYAIAWVLGVDLLATVTPWPYATSISRAELGTALLLATLSIAYSASVVTLERVRVLLAKGTSPDMCPNLSGIWTFAAAVLLPMQLAAAVLLVAFIGDWPARNVARQTTLYRYIYSGASALLAVAAAHACVSMGVPGWIALPLAGISYVAVSCGLIVLAMTSVGQLRAAEVFLKPRTHTVGVQVIVIGICEAACQFAHLPLVTLSFPAAIAIQRRWARDAISRATKLPDPMPEKVWRHVARGLLAGCPFVGLLRVDQDDPATLRALAEIQSPCDAIGRYRGGLAILLVDAPETHADALALRLRITLAKVSPSARVASAASPRDGRRLTDLLVITEADLSVPDVNRPAPSSFLD